MDYLVSGLEMAELDRQAIQDLGIPGRVLMECAGRAVAEYCHRRLGKTGRIVVACGGGNNGGDGFVAARLLAERGHDVSVFVFADVSRIAGDAKANLATLKTAGGVRVVEGGGPSVLLELASALGGADLALDALLGTGLRDDVRGSIGEAIDLFNRESCPVVAVDVPSGIDADTGRVLGRGVEAVATVTFAFAKRGHYLHPGMEQRGELTVADIGIPAKAYEALGLDVRDLFARGDLLRIVRS